MKTPLRALPAVLSAAAAALMALPARAARTIAPGIAYSNAGGYHVVVADNDSAGVEIHVAKPYPTPRENKRTVAQRGRETGALVAINANFFGGPLNYPCGAARGYGYQYPGIYAEAKNCETTMGWARGKGGLFNSAGREADSKWASQYTELATGGGALLVSGRPVQWNATKLAAGRPCTAIGMSADRKRFIFVVTNTKVCTGQGLQKVLLSAGAADAVHLDGGGSSKMWIRGSGYVNNVGEDRAPPVVIIAKGASKCPGDCGKAECVQLPPPYDAQCVGGACRNGLTPVWTCDYAVKGRVRCDQGRVVREPCAVGCIPKPQGTHDSCGPCPAGNGLYCGGNMVSGEPNILYRCTNGSMKPERSCAKGCKRMPAGVNDLCN